MSLTRLAGLPLGLLSIAACGPTSAGTSSSDGTGSSASSGSTDTTAGTTAGTSAGTTATGTTGTSAAATSSGSSSGGGDECAEDSDCLLLDDCCACDAVPVVDNPGSCDLACDQSACSALNLDGVTAACRLGRCEFAPLGCNPATVTCDSLPPDCAAPQIPRVVDGCWSGCIDPRSCDVLADCTHETCGPGWMCVDSQVTFPPHCEPVPWGCGQVPACDCLGDHLLEVCEASCVESGEVIYCQDGG